MVEVDRPNRQRRRRAGKSDTHDAVIAARAAFAGDALGEPKTRDGNVEAIRVLRLARSSARRDRTRALNQMRALITTAPDELRSQLRGLTIPRLVRTAAGFRPAGRTDVTNANRVALKTLARRVLELDDEIDMLDECSLRSSPQTAPEMIERVGVGTDTAGALLVAAGENTSRIRNERSFARLCGAAPLDASSGKQQRHRLSRAGDRQANSALWRIVITRLSYDPATRATSNDAAPKARPKPKRSAASSATSHASSTHASRTNTCLTAPRSINLYAYGATEDAIDDAEVGDLPDVELEV